MYPHHLILFSSQREGMKVATKSDLIKVKDKPDLRISKTGTAYVTFFGVNKKNDLLPFIAFHDIAEACHKSLKVGLEVSIVYQNSTKGDKLIIQAFHIINSNIAKEKPMKQFKDINQQNNHEHYYQHKNLVPVKRGNFKYFIKKDYCSFVNGEWIETIDAIMDILGPKEVSEELKKLEIPMIEWIKKKAKELGLRNEK